MEDTSKYEAPTPDAMPLGMLPGMWKELPWRWWVQLPASCSSEGRMFAREIFFPEICLSFWSVPTDRCAGPIRSKRSVRGPADR